KNSNEAVDILVQYSDKVIPVEVKAEENLQAKSLKSFCQKYSPSLAIRTSMSDYREEEWMINLPLYAFNEITQS
ncbi:MAG: ATPase, partial [Bacteroidales bacterium]